MKNILVVALNEDELYARQFIDPITDTFLLENFSVRYYKNINSLDINTFTHIIISGTYLKDSSYLENLEYFSWIKKYKNNLLGICAGSQIISMIYNSKTIQLKNIGLISLDIILKDKLFDSISFSRCYSLHNLIFSVPKNFEILAQHDSIPRIVKKNKTYLFSFHPEVYQKNILTNFINL